MQFEQLGSLATFLRFFFRREFAFRQRNTALLRYESDGFREADVLNLLDEGEDVAGNTAAEAVEELPRCVDGKRRRFLLVEGTQSAEILRSSLL